MRPRLLELTAFGPYAQTVRVDFDELASAGLFLIHGPTGGGKTSLLDGLCYALYGTVPGARRPDGLRSDHAAADVETSVVLEFSLDGVDWRVTRRPPHRRAKRRGSGTTRQKPTATLSRRGSAAGGWEAVATGVEDVGDTVLRLIGLDAGQFQQVVLLPQGQVQEALAADARDRERLLSSLFDSSRFGRYAERLAAEARDAEAALARQQAAITAVHAEAARRWAEIAPDPPPRASAAGEPPTGADGTGGRATDKQDAEAPLPGPGDIDCLAGATTDGDPGVLAARAAVARDEAAAVLAVAQERRSAAQAASAEAGLLTERWDRREEAAATLIALDAEGPEIDRLVDLVDRAVRAAPCAGTLAAADAAAQALTSSRDVLVDTGAAVADRAAALPSALDALRAAAMATVDHRVAVSASPERSLAVARRGVIAEDARLALFAERCQEAEECAAAAAAARDRAAAALRRAADEDAAAAQADRDAATAESARDRARVDAARVPALVAEADRLADVAAAAHRVAEVAAAAEDAKAAALAARQASNDAERRHLDLLRRRIEGMAAELADGLQEGSPCPVCGAEEHPAPAIGHVDGTTSDQVEAAEEVAFVARRAADRADAELVEARLAADRAIAAAGDAATDPARAGRHADDARRAADQAASLAAQLEEIETRLAGQVRIATRHRAAAGTARADAAAADAQGHALTTQAEAITTEVCAAVGDDNPQAALTAVRALHDALDRHAQAVTASQRAEAHAATCQRQLADLLTELGFPDAAAAAAAAIRAPDDVADMRRRVADHQRARAAADAALADPALRDLPPRPDLERARADCASAEAAADAATARTAAAERAADALGGLALTHRELAAAQAPLAVRAERLRHLADACAGSGNALRMSLERYVLAAHLEEITAAASVRLKAMTDGRYTLRHSDERARHGAASGLAILAVDAFAGAERDVGTLSGGETFQAALALALGVADVVARHAGGIRLDALFVDEGFGALDPDALEQAMAELDRLREGGRMVGVISHVPTLRERIPAGVEVRRTRTGSTARVRALAAV